MVKADLFPNPGDRKIRLKEQQLGALDAEPHQIVEWGAAELLLHAPCDIDGMEVNALAQLLSGYIFTVMLPQIGGCLFRAEGGGRGSLHLHRSGQLFNHLLKYELLLPFHAWDMIIHIELDELPQQAVQLGGLQQLGELGQLFREGLCCVKTSRKRFLFGRLRLLWYSSLVRYAPGTCGLKVNPIISGLFLAGKSGVVMGIRPQNKRMPRSHFVMLLFLAHVQAAARNHKQVKYFDIASAWMFPPRGSNRITSDYIVGERRNRHMNDRHGLVCPLLY